MFQTMMSLPEYRENVLLHLMDNDHMMLANGIELRKMSDMDTRFWMRAIVPTDLTERLDLVRADVITLLMHLVETMLSETTNNDSCRIAIHETAAHFSEYDHMAEYEMLPFGSVVIYDAEVEDYLS